MGTRNSAQAERAVETVINSASFNEKVTAQVGVVATPIIQQEIAGQVAELGLVGKIQSFDVAIGGDSDKFYPVVLSPDSESVGTLIVDNSNRRLAGVPTAAVYASYDFVAGAFSSYCGVKANFGAIYSRQLIARIGVVADKLVIWLRGGHTYRLKSDQNIQPVVYDVLTEVYVHPNNVALNRSVEPLLAVDGNVQFGDSGIGFVSGLKE